MNVENYNVMMASARAPLYELVRRVGKYTYSVPLEDRFIQLSVSEACAVKVRGLYRGPYFGLPEYFPLSSLEFSHLAIMAEAAARELASQPDCAASAPALS